MFAESDREKLSKLCKLAAEKAAEWTPEHARAVYHAMSLVREDRPDISDALGAHPNQPWQQLSKFCASEDWIRCQSKDQRSFLLSAILVKLEAGAELKD